VLRGTHVMEQSMGHLAVRWRGSTSLYFGGQVMQTNLRDRAALSAETYATWLHALQVAAFYLLYHCFLLLLQIGKK
jgi:hypothetical protein